MSRAPAPDEAWIGLGSNLGDREAHLHAAAERFGDAVVLMAPIVETEPWGITEQPWFLNTVLRLRWTHGARALLALCLETERALGRVRVEKNGPRTVDVDVLLCGPGLLDEPGLTVPHPGIATRRSVLEPWAAVAPDLVVPGLIEPLSALRDAAAELPGQGVRAASSPRSSASGTL